MGAAVLRLVGRVRVAAVWLAVSLLAPAAFAQSPARVDGPRRRSGGCGLAGRSSEHRRFQRTRPPHDDNEWRRTVQRRSPPGRAVHRHRRTAAIHRGRAAGHRAANGRVACPAIRARGWRFLGRRRSHRAQGGDTNHRHAAEGGSDRCDGYRTDRGSGPDRRHEEERGGRRHPVRGRALRHRDSRIPAAVLGHQQALTAAHRRPPVRRHQSRDPAPGRHRSHRGPQGGGLVDLRLLGDGRGRERHHATVAGQDWRHGAFRRWELWNLRFRRSRWWQRVVASGLRSGRRDVRPA